MFKDRLYIINKDLQEHKRPRDEVMEQAITDRLSSSLESYLYDIGVSYSYLADRSPTRLYGRLSRRKIKDD